MAAPRGLRNDDIATGDEIPVVTVSRFEAGLVQISINNVIKQISSHTEAITALIF